MPVTLRTTVGRTLTHAELDGNFTSFLNLSGNTVSSIFSPTFISNVSTGTAPLTVSSTTKVTNLNADSVDGLDVHTGTNNEANKIVRTDANGYIQAGWINTSSGDNGTTAIDRVYASNDGYIRYYSPANFRTVLNVPTVNRAVAMALIFGS